MNSVVVTKDDPWVRERLKTHTFWVAVLSNGEEIYQSDGHPDGREPIPEDEIVEGGPTHIDVSSWFRLKNYCQENNLFIQTLDLKFRSHTERVGECGPFYFINAAIGGFGMPTQHFYIVGTLENDGKVHTKKWKIPELLSMETDIREPDEELMI